VQIPSLEGQPGWVVIIVFALAVFGTIATLVIKNRVSKEEKKTVPALPETTPTALPLPRDSNENITAFALIQAAMEHLAETARREAAQGEEAEHKVEELRRQLEDCKRELQTVQRRLEECQDNAHRLAQRAYEPRQNNG
jgi:DNA repair ATPase RecN